MLLEVRSLVRAFGPKRLFGPLSFEVPEGKVLGVAGANGAGKTTLVKTLVGLQRPNGGTVAIATSREAGAPMAAPRDAPWSLGWVAPDLALYGELTAVENLAFFARVKGDDPAPARIEGLVDDAGLDPKRVRGVPTRFLSTGQRHRLKLVFGTLGDPLVLFLDEPTSNLDEAGRAVVEKIVARQRRRGAVVLASNDARDLALADEVVTL